MKKRLFMMLMLGLFMTGCAGKEETVPAPETEVHQEVQQEEVATEAEAQVQQEQTQSESVQEGEYKLTFQAKTIDGVEITSDILANSKLTMINVWATTCFPCVEEMPAIAEIAASYDQKDFQVIGIISDVQAGASDEDIETARKIIERTKADYPHLLLNHSLVENLVNGVTVVPTTFFVNSKGEPVGYIIGANDKESWEEIITDLLKQEETINE